MRGEDIDVAEGRVSEACDRTTVMQKLPDLVPAFSHHLKPPVRDSAQLPCVLSHPRLDRGIFLDSTVEAEEVASHLRREPNVRPGLLLGIEGLLGAGRGAGDARGD